MLIETYFLYLATDMDCLFQTSKIWSKIKFIL